MSGGETNMKYAGTIIRIQRSRAGVTLIIETAIGLRGVELDQELWAEIQADFGLTEAHNLVGWAVAYDPAHGDLEISTPDHDEQAGIDDDPPRA
jgi:hypothetical protein